MPFALIKHHKGRPRASLFLWAIVFADKCFLPCPSRKDTPILTGVPANPASSIVFS